jgi:hypothetical protein
MVHAIDSVVIKYKQYEYLSSGATYPNSISTTTHFYVSEISAAGCEGPRTDVLATVNVDEPEMLVTVKVPLYPAGNKPVITTTLPTTNVCPEAEYVAVVEVYETAVIATSLGRTIGVLVICGQSGIASPKS